MNEIRLNDPEFTGLTLSESVEINGGFFFLLHAYPIVSTALVAYGAFMAGYDAACN
jgi:hypothetical protein